MRIFFGSEVEEFSPRLLDSHPKLKALGEFWSTKRKSANGERYPARQLFNFETLKPWLGHVSLLDVIGEPARFRVRLMGTDVVRLAGGDYTGRYLDDAVAAGQQHTALRPLMTCVASGQPVYDRVPSALPGLIPAGIDRLYLPCATDGNRIDSLVVGIYATDKGMASHSTM